MQDNITKLALDIGNGKIKAVLGELSTEGLKLKVLDYIESPSQGIKRSVVEDSDLLAETLKNVIKELEQRTGRDFERVSLGISNDRILSKTDHGCIDFDEKEITDQDMVQLIDSVRNTIVSDDEIVIEEEIYNVRVNSSGILKNPIGQVGKSLQGDVHFITLKKEEANPLIECVNKAGLEVEDMFLNASASAKATLDTEDRQMGVALIDIGEGATDIAIYKNDKIIYTKSLSIGGMHFVNDLSYLLKITKREAKEILEKLRVKDYANGILTVEGKNYDVEEIKSIIDARTGDLINFISKTIEESGFNGYLGKGLAFTGGAVSIDEIFSKVGSKMECAVRKVAPCPLRGLEEIDPAMSTVIGILLNKLEMEFIKQKDRVDEEEVSQEEVESNLESFDSQESSEERSDFFRQEDFEEDFEEETDEANGALGKIKKWISNFI